MNLRIASPLLFITLLVLSSCTGDDLAAPNMPQVQFTQLKAGQYTLSPNSTTRVSAVVENKCNLVGFEWSCNDGRIEGSDDKVTFMAPQQSGDAQVSCTVTHPGRQPVTKTITIHIK
ncbi:MAG: hypothetical protein K1X63_08115 [Chitinophagales bacterium]|nr:hypothetical protein [Chitinophagales bacterium]